MTKNKFNLDLIFLYQEPLIRSYSTADNDQEYNDWRYKYEKQEDSFGAFVKKCSLNDLVYLFVCTFKEKFPNVLKLGFSVGTDPYKISETLKSFKKYDRKDVKEFLRELNIGAISNELTPEIRDIYETKVTLKFNKTYSLTAIEEALEGISYTRNNLDNKTDYIIEDAPLKKIEATSNNLTIHINEDKIYKYYRQDFSYEN